MQSFNSCYKCQERYVGCHDKCLKYQTDKENYKKAKQWSKDNEYPIPTTFCSDYYERHQKQNKNK